MHLGRAVFVLAWSVAIVACGGGVEASPCDVMPSAVDASAPDAVAITEASTRVCEGRWYLHDPYVYELAVDRVWYRAAVGAESAGQARATCSAILGGSRPATSSDLQAFRAAPSCAGFAIEPGPVWVADDRCVDLETDSPVECPWWRRVLCVAGP